MTSATTAPDTRASIVRSAERLFARHGVEGVSLREITREAESRNTSALQYHFGDRDGLLRAILQKHRADTEPRRHALLDRYDEDGDDDVRALAAALVLPLAGKLADPDGGRAYLRINAELSTRPGVEHLLVSRDRRNSMRRWHATLDALAPEQERTALHSRFPAIRLAFVELARRAADRPRADDRLFTSHLIDLVAAILLAPPSPATTRLLEGRSATGRSRR